MDDLERRVQTLEAKVKVLEETLETLKDMHLSEQMQDYIQAREKTLKIVGLVNSVSEQPSLDFEQEQKQLEIVQTAKKTVDQQIAEALQHAGAFSEDLPSDPSYFNYEVESDPVINSLWERTEKSAKLAGFIGNGLKITAYTGFDAKRVIIPNEIDGRPVISIGAKAFMNATVSEVILPKSLKAILSGAFHGCKDLKHIDLPDSIVYMGDYCFAGSGLTDFTCPSTLEIIPYACFSDCTELKKVILGNHVTKIGEYAFQNCSNLHSISLPESLLAVGSCAFVGTQISTIIFPSNVKEISADAFDYYREVVCVFLGKDTTVCDYGFSASLIYCLPGSKIQQIAREHGVPMRPLSEFRMEGLYE